MTNLLRNMLNMLKRKKIHIHLTYRDLEGLSHEKSKLQTKMHSVLLSLF